MDLPPGAIIPYLEPAEDNFRDLRSSPTSVRPRANRRADLGASDHAAEAETLAVSGAAVSRARVPPEPAEASAPAFVAAPIAHLADRRDLPGAGPAKGLQRTVAVFQRAAGRRSAGHRHEPEHGIHAGRQDEARRGEAAGAGATRGSAGGQPGSDSRYRRTFR